MKFSRRLVQATRWLPTPVLVMDGEALRRSFEKMRAAFPGAEVFYAVKANAHPEVLRILAQVGSGFEVSSMQELQAVLELGVGPERIVSSNPVKAPAFLDLARAVGVDRFAADSEVELAKLARYNPGSRVYIRVMVDNSGSEWPLSRKYGVGPKEARMLLRQAARLGLDPYGLTFHVGSQCLDAGSWARALAVCREVWSGCAEDGIRLRMLSLGGGMPVHHVRPVPSFQEIGRVVRRTLADLFPGQRLELAVEPGRALVGEAGVLVGTVIGKATRGSEEWVYLDLGVFNALMETIQGFRYEVRTERTGPCRSYTLAGPTCDSVDTIFTDIRLPEVKVGDRVYILNAGAYTLSYASSFNGFPPPAVHFLGGPLWSRSCTPLAGRPEEAGASAGQRPRPGT